MKRTLPIMITAGLSAIFLSFCTAGAQEPVYGTSAGISLANSAGSVIAGDVNGDSALNHLDLLRLAKSFSGLEVEINEKAADVTGDGTLNSQDLLLLAKYFAGWDVVLETQPEPEQPDTPNIPSEPEYDSDDDGWSGIYRP